jgi:hypothetical protein
MTAVEWVLDWMSKNQYFIGNDLLKAVEQVKQMEKEQIENAWNDGKFESSGCIEAEQYYNETFKSE